MKKKILSILLATSLLTGMLTGCTFKVTSNGKDITPSVNGNTGTEAVEEETNTEPVKIDIGKGNVEEPTPEPVEEVVTESTGSSNSDNVQITGNSNEEENLVTDDDIRQLDGVTDDSFTFGDFMSESDDEEDKERTTKKEVVYEYNLAFDGLNINENMTTKEVYDEFMKLDEDRLKEMVTKIYTESSDDVTAEDMKPVIDNFDKGEISTMFAAVYAGAEPLEDDYEKWEEAFALIVFTTAIETASEMETGTADTTQ